jgi:hypothetical protein
VALTLFRHDFKQAAARERRVAKSTAIPAFRGQAANIQIFR